MRRALPISVGCVTLVVLLIGAALPSVAGAQSLTTAKRRALSNFAAKQVSSGGFGASSQRPMVTPWVVQAIAATGRNPSSFRRSGGKSAVAYLQSLNMAREATSGSGATSNPAAFYAKMIVTYRAAKASSLIRRAGSKHVNLVKGLLRYRNSANGSFTTTLGGRGSYAAISTTTWAVIALRAAGRTKAQLAKSVSWLRGRQSSSGGFAFMPGVLPDTDSTAAAIEALRTGGVSASAKVIRRAISYLHRQEKGNGGFTTGSGGTTNAESTASAVEAIRAIGQNPTSASWRRSGKTPIAFLLSLQARSGAFYHYGRTFATPLLTTSQVIVALSGKHYPF